MDPTANKMSFEEYLDAYGELTYANQGVSMLPLIKQGRDMVILKKKDKNTRCKKYDVAMYVGPEHKYILHRIIKVKDDCYDFLGDNLLVKELDVKEDQVIAVMTEFVHKGKRHSVTDKGYLWYVRIWMFLTPVRIFVKKYIWIPIHKLINKLRGK